VRLGQGEGRDGARRAAREVLLLLLGRPEQLQRLRHADRLVRGEQRADVAVEASDELHDGHVLAHAEAEPAVLLRDLEPERAELAQPVDDFLRVLAGLVDDDRIDLLAQERREPVVERPELRPPFARRREGMDVLEEEVAEEQLAQERPPCPLLLAGLLRDLSGLFFTGRSCVRRHWDTPPYRGWGGPPPGPVP